MVNLPLRRFRQAIPIYVLALPALISFIVFTYYPALLGFIISFQTYRIVGASEWVGLRNYLQVFRTYGFWNVAGNTAAIGGAGLVVNIVIPVALALLLNEVRSRRWKGFLQTSLFIPHLFSWVVVAGIWIAMLAPDRGMVNLALERLGVRAVPFMSRAEWGKPVVVFLMVWREAGYLCVLYLAAISAIDPGLYESAVIDGAGRLRQAVSITLPMLVPTVKILAILGVTGMFQLFDPIWVLRNTGNSLAIDTVMIYVKEYGIDRLQMGYTSAISVLIFAVILLVTVSAQRALRYRI